MDDDSVGRRSVLRSAGVAAGGTVFGAVALGSPASAREHHHHDDVSGSWLTNVHNDDGEESVSVLSFAAGDVCVVHDISPAGPPFTGTWRSRHHESFRATVLTGTPGDGPGAAGAVIELKLRGAVRHGRMSGTFTFTVSGPDGQQVDAGSGSFDGRPIEA